MPRAGVHREAGFTLLEVIVSLALFAMISLAAFTMLNGVLGVQQRLDGRTERLGQIQRAMYVLTLDLEQVSAGSLNLAGDVLQFRKHSPDGGGPAVDVRYDLDDGVFRRTLQPETEFRRTQPLLQGVAAVRWRFYFAVDGWHDDLPPPQAVTTLPGQSTAASPDAIAIDLALGPDASGPSGVLRRVVSLPARP